LTTRYLDRASTDLPEREETVTERNDAAAVTASDELSYDALPLVDTLPDRPDVGQYARFALPYTLADDATPNPDGRARRPAADAVNRDLLLVGTFLGVGTSRREHHRHDRNAAPTPGEPCSACRWYELRLFLVRDCAELTLNRNVPTYVLHHTGASDLPNERDFYRYESVDGAFALVEKLTVRNARNRRIDEPFLTKPGAEALAVASSLDADVREAFVNRATS
jgi:hypothetical protein